jgi:hypothetical protein
MPGRDQRRASPHPKGIPAPAPAGRLGERRQPLRITLMPGMDEVMGMVLMLLAPSLARL